MVSIRMPIEMVPLWKAAAERQQMTGTGFILDALHKAIARASDDARQGCSTDTASTV
jgi:hypothetical protein